MTEVGEGEMMRVSTKTSGKAEMRFSALEWMACSRR